ncbi:MAG: DUF4303 domain-containing protein [Tannerella sp.]|jgi:hypothetical protein|nr:DUF4303 domain-containing protein [Tannerella sp.]
MKNDIEILTDEIVKAARKSFLELFENGEEYYYCSLVTIPEGFCPIVSAWSWEALKREAKRQGCQEANIKWSYADSPYCIFGEENFKDVTKLFFERPTMQELDDDDWDKEFNLRLQSMELAMKKLDEEGLFEKNQSRDSVCVLVEIMTPDEINTKIALRLNDPESKAMKSWLSEAAETFE